MAKAYDHMPVFQRVRYFVEQRISELEDKIEEAESEARMWHEVEAQNLFNGFEAWRMAQTADAAAVTFEVELGKWRHFYDSMNVCDACNGYGEIREIISQDESRNHKCDVCGGSGRRA